MQELGCGDGILPEPEPRGSEGLSQEGVQGEALQTREAASGTAVKWKQAWSVRQTPKKACVAETREPGPHRW